MYEHYKCEFCNYPVDPKGESTAEMVTVWLVKGRAIKNVQKTWRYAHKVCIESPVKNNGQESLFG